MLELNISFKFDALNTSNFWTTDFKPKFGQMSHENCQHLVVGGRVLPQDVFDDILA